MTVFLVISLPKTPYIHRIYMVLANPINIHRVVFACLQVPVRLEEVMTNYTVLVKTSDLWGAGTDANVMISIFGTKDGKVRARC